MQLQHFARIQLSPAEERDATLAARALRREYGPAAINHLARRARADLTAYGTLTLSLNASGRAALAKRLRSYLTVGDLLQPMPAGGFVEDLVSLAHAPKGGITIAGRYFVGGRFIPNAVMEQATAGQRQQLDAEQEGVEDVEIDTDAALRWHLMAAMIDVAAEYKQRGDDEKSKTVLHELADLGSAAGIDELKEALARFQNLGLAVEPQWLSWVRRGTSRSGKTRWWSEETHEYRYQNTEPGTRQRRVEDQGVAKGHLDRIRNYEDVTEDHLNEMAEKLSSLTVEQLRSVRMWMGSRQVGGGRLKESMVKAIREYASKHVQTYTKRGKDADAAAQQQQEAAPGEQAGPPISSPDHPDAKIVNDIDPKASPEEKVAQLAKMTAQNQPLVDAFLKKLDAKFGTKSGSNVKLPDRILSKSQRPSIKAAKPWFDVEHLRDSFRFKSVMSDITKLPEMIEFLENELGAEVVKRDTDKFMKPLAWGFRICAFDLKMPNGQLVEYYLPVEEMEKQKGPNHKIFEKWRNEDLSKLTPEQTVEFEKDQQESRRTYQAAFDSYLERSGNQESDIRAALAKASASSSGTAKNSSAISSPDTKMPGDQAPSSSLVAEKPSSSTTARPSGAADTVAMTEPSTGDSASASGDFSKDDPIAAAIMKAGGPDELTADSVDEIRKSLYRPGEPNPTAADIHAAAEKIRQSGGENAGEPVVPPPVKNPASDHAQAIRALYDVAGRDTTIPMAEIQETLAGMDKLPKAGLLHIADEMEIVGLKNKSLKDIRDAIKRKIIDHRGMAQRGEMLYDDPETQAELDAQRAKHAPGVAKWRDLAAKARGVAGEQPEEGVSNDKLETGRAGGDQGGLHAGQPVGTDAAPPPDAAVPGTGQGTPADGRPGRLPAGDDPQRDGTGLDARGPGDQPGDGARVGDAGIAAGPAGRTGPAGGVGAGGGGVGGVAGRPAIPDPTPAERVVAQEPTKDNPTDLSAGNFRYHDEDRAFAKGGLKAKFNANIEAIKTLRAIQAEGRTTATPEEQAILSKFVGWGQFPGVFNSYGYGGQEQERKALQALLTPEEWDAARKSTLNAHFTHPEVVDAHWKLAERLGFKGGRFLETSAGIGYYLGMMPPHIAANTRAAAVELDDTTGNMLKLLYPAANVQVQGFQEHKAPDGFYDLIASNVPFGDYRVHDPEYNRHQANIHDYFFLKSADKVRPGGLVMHITSTGTMDKGDSKIREELAKTCDLVSAIRFPGGAHKENAGTEVVTDMLILRKRLPGEKPNGVNWMATTTVPDPAGGEPIPVNQYFADNPDQILGKLDRTGTMYAGQQVNVSKTDDYEQRLAAAIERVPQGVMTKAVAPKARFAPEAMPAEGETKNGGFHVKDGKVFVREGGGMTEQAELPPAKAAKIQAHLTVRDAARAVLNAQLKGENADAARQKLNEVYDAFVKQHGFLNDKANRQVFRTDPDAPVLLAMEKWDAKTRKATKADIFSKDTIRAVPKVEKAGTVDEALGVSIHESGSIDIAHMAKLTGHQPEHVAKHLTDTGLAFEDPGEGWKPAAHYLSGNVRRKLALARAAAATDPKFQHNVAALEKVQPEDLDHEDIDVKLGAPWVPPTDIKNFAAHLLNSDPKSMDVHYVAGQWMAKYSTYGDKFAARSSIGRAMGTDRFDFDEVLHAALNNTTLKAYDKDPDGKAVLNKQATDDAQAKVQEIKDKFKEWIWEDDERRERLHRHYNDNFNNIVEMKYDGSHQTFPGMNPAIKLHAHIPNFVWQVVTTGKGLAAHEVGMGKTFAMIASAMELRRLGLARKPAIACMKANIEAITNDCLKLYPGAKILSTADMFDAASRKKTISQIATGDYDMVLLTHDHLDLLQMKPETIKAHISEELDELEAAKVAAEKDNPKKGNRVVKALEKAKARLEARLQEALDATNKDDAIFFEESGIDHLFVDEAHKYKSLPCYTKQERLKGVPNSRSDRATAMLMRTRWLMEQNNGRGVTFATGTPVANTMAELYNMQRYLQPQELKERGIENFDAWANVFGDVQNKMEFTVAGEYKPVSRFAKFVNLPELMQLTRQFMDVQRVEGMPESTIERPKRKDSVIAAPKSPAMESLMKELQQRAKDISKGGGKAEKGSDNMLVICTDGRKGALDMRLLDAGAEDDPQSKTNLAVENVLKLHKANPTKSQLIFSDIGVNPTEQGFHLYGDIIDKLVKGGIPRDKIADFSQLEGQRKEAAMEAMRKGDIHIGIGSTSKLGTGVNVQNKLAALHHLDVPWMPADVEQRDGRGWRHGNELHKEGKPLGIYRYVAEGSLDQTFWQIIGNKSRFIKQVLTPSSKVQRVAADEDTEELTPDQLMAAASGDPRVMEKVQLDDDVRTLQQARTRHDREQQRLKDSVSRSERTIPTMEKSAERIRKAAATVEKHPEFLLEIDGQKYTDRKEAEAAYTNKSTKIDAEASKTWNPGYHEAHVGTFRGLDILRRGQNHYLTDGEEEIGTGPALRSIEAVARQLGRKADEADAAAKKAREDIEKVKASIGKPFAKADVLKERMDRLKELERDLAGKKDDEPDDVAGGGGPAVGAAKPNQSSGRLNVDSAYELVHGLYKRALEPDLTEDSIIEQLSGLGQLSKDDLNELWAKGGGRVKHTTKKAAVDAIQGMILKRKGAYARASI